MIGKINFKRKEFILLTLLILIFNLISINFLSNIYVNNINEKSDKIINKPISFIHTSLNHPPNASNFYYYKDITIDYTKVSGSSTHTNFPLLISILDSDLHDHVNQSNGNDIAFWNGSEWLDHEIELFKQNYNDTHAQLITWVRIPKLYTSVNTTIRMYYGNSTVTSRQNPTGVWDSHYRIVLHLNETIGSTAYDSTSNNEDGTIEGSGITFGAIGKIGQCYQFDDTPENQRVQLPSIGALNAFTMEIWVYPHSGEKEAIWGRSFLINRGSGPMMEAAGITDPTYGGGEFGAVIPNGLWGSASATEISGNSETSINSWNHFSVTYNGSALRMYINGNEVADSPKTSMSSPNYLFNGEHFLAYAGYHYNDETEYLDGKLDEVHLLDVARNADWITTEYNNQNDPNTFFNVGSEETLDNTPPTYSNLIESSDPLELGETEIIEINVSDPSGINQVKIQFEGSNHSMTNIGGDKWQYDSWTPNSVGNYTYIIYMEDNHNNWNSTSDSIKVVDTTPPTYSNLIESADPLKFGQNETISIKVFDSPGSGVNQTVLEYDLLNHTMNFIGENTWSWDNWQPTSEGIYFYKIYMQDIQNNWNMVSGNITVITTTAPIMENLTESVDPLEFGNNISFTIDVFDNETFVDTVFIELEGVNHTMINIGGNTYEYIWTGTGVGTFQYTIYANDTGNNWNKITSIYDVVDTTPPTFTNLSESKDPLELGSTEIIFINATDLTGINQVKIEFEGVNHSMMHISGDMWQYDSWTPSITGNYSYTIWIEDNNYNWNFSMGSILVQDTTPPLYSDLTESADPIELGTLLIITINVTDLSNVNRVLIEFENSNHTMIKISEDIWQYDSWMPNRVDNYSYTIYMEDINNNWNYTSGSIIFQDTISPVYSNLIESADPLELGDTIIIRIDIEDFAGINQSLIEFEGSNHSMTNIYGNVWQYDSWTPNNWIVYHYKIFMEDKSGNWNFTSGNVTIQDTTPPSPPVITSAPSGDVSGILTFDWLDGFDPSGISFYRLIIDNESDPFITAGYVFEFNITNIGPESSYLELPEIFPSGRYYYFLSQIDGVGRQSSFTIGTFTMISKTNNTDLMFFIIIALISISAIVSITTIIIVKRRSQKKILPPRKKIPLKIIIPHIDKISNSQLIFEKIESQKKAIVKKINEKLDEKELINEHEVENQINKIKTLGEELFGEGAYLEAQKQFELVEKLLIKLGRKEEACLYSELIIGIKELNEEREKRLEILEQEKLEGDTMKILDLYFDIIEISKKLKDIDAINMYKSELTQLFQADKQKEIDLEYQRLILEEQANSLLNDNFFENAAELYEKCEKISQFLVQLGKDEEITNVNKFKKKRNECLNYIS